MSYVDQNLMSGESVIYRTRLHWIIFLAPMVVHGAHRLSDDELEQEAALYAERLGSYPAWPELDDMDACVACEVPASARPTDDLASPAPEGPMSAAKAGASTVRRAA